MYRRDQGEVLRSEVVGGCLVQERRIAVAHVVPGGVQIRPVVQYVVTWGEPTAEGWYAGDIALSWWGACHNAALRGGAP